jgi:hypothetical protein
VVGKYALAPNIKVPEPGTEIDKYGGLLAPVPGYKLVQADWARISTIFYLGGIALGNDQENVLGNPLCF